MIWLQITATVIVCGANVSESVDEVMQMIRRSELCLM